jgi:ABC transporter transmembrane region
MCAATAEEQANQHKTGGETPVSTGSDSDLMEIPLEDAEKQPSKASSNGTKEEPKKPPQASPRRGFSGKTYNNGREMGVWETSLEDRASCISTWVLSFLDPLLVLGANKVLEADDMGVPSKQDEAANAYQIAHQAWIEQSAKADRKNAQVVSKHQAKLARCKTAQERDKLPAPVLNEPSIAWALLKGFGAWKVVLSIIYYMISALLGFVPVLVLNSLVKLFQSGQTVQEYDGWLHPWFQVALLAIIPSVNTLLQTRNQVIMAHCAVFVRTAVSMLLYRKALRVSASGRAKTSTGQVVNMMSNDTAQLQRFLQFVGMTIVAPIQIIIALVLIYQQVS